MKTYITMMKNIDDIIREHAEYQKALADLGLALIDGLLSGSVNLVDGEVGNLDYDGCDCDCDCEGYCGCGEDDGYDAEACEGCPCDSCPGECETCKDMPSPPLDKEDNASEQAPQQENRSDVEDILKVLFGDKEKRPINKGNVVKFPGGGISFAVPEKEKEDKASAPRSVKPLDLPPDVLQTLLRIINSGCSNK